MPPVILFSRNILETSTIAVTSAVAGFPKERLWDRDRNARWKATSNAVQKVEIDQGAVPLAFSHVILANYALSTNIEVYRGAAYPPATLVATLTPAGDPYLAALGGVFTDRYAEVRMLGGGAVPEAGEISVTKDGTLSRKPVFGGITESLVGNVTSYESPAGFPWAFSRGGERMRLIYDFRNLPDADVATVLAAARDVGLGLKFLPVQDLAGTLWWMRWVRPELARQLVSDGRRALTLEFLEVPVL
jgi:hypothetical protein